MNSEILRQRLRETFGTDAQEKIGSKLNMAQGTISKMLTGAQQPTLETIYRVAQVYDVSVDWLLGLSENKYAGQRFEDEAITYYSVVRAAVSLSYIGLDIEIDNPNNEVHARLKDPLLCELLAKGLGLRKLELDAYLNWKNEKLSLFKNKRIIETECWKYADWKPYASRACSVFDWLDIYEDAEKEEEFLWSLREP